MTTTNGSTAPSLRAPRAGSAQRAAIASRRVSDPVSPAAIVQAAWREGRLAYPRTADGDAGLAAAHRRARHRRRRSPGATAPASGTVYATTALHARDAPPRNVALIDLDEGFRMMSRVEGAPRRRGADRAARARAVHRRRPETGDRLPVFVPDGRTHDLPAAGERRHRRRRRVRPRRRARGHPARSTSWRRPRCARWQDAGLTPADVDGVFAATTQLPMAPLNLALELGIDARCTDATNVGGSSFMFHVAHARSAIAAGVCDVALVAYGSTQRLVGRSSASVQELDPWEAPYRPAMPVTAYAPRRRAAHARVRHHARAARERRGRRPRVGGA